MHCPQSNLKLGSGVADIGRMQRRGLLVGLGTDGAAANNSLDMFTEARAAALLAKTVSGDPTALDAHAALELATLGSARALGLDAIVGSIEPGKAADLISIDLTHTGALPVHRPESTLLYTASGSHVQNAWVAGRQLLDRWQSDDARRQPAFTPARRRGRVVSRPRRRSLRKSRGGHNVDHSEVAKFESLAHRWWDPEGEFRTLHDINPLRLDYIARHCDLVGKRVVDIGCGGGILAEAMARPRRRRFGMRPG